MAAPQGTGALRRARPDLYHDTKNALPWRLAAPAVVTVHDLPHLRCPETFGLASRLFLRWSTADAVRRARVVIVPSESTERDLAEPLPASAGKVRVVPHGIASPAPPSEDALNWAGIISDARTATYGKQAGERERRQ